MRTGRAERRVVPEVWGVDKLWPRHSVGLFVGSPEVGNQLVMGHVPCRGFAPGVYEAAYTTGWNRKIFVVFLTVQPTCYQQGCCWSFGVASSVLTA